MSVANILTRLAGKIQKVFDAGKQSAYDEFWDSYQNNGARTACRAMFSGYGWTKETLKPKHHMSPTNAVNLFDFNRVVLDMRELGVDIDFSNCSELTQAFNNSRVTYVTEIDASKCANYYYLFNNCQDLVTIELFKVNANATYNNTFYACSSLENIVFEGVIGNSLNMQYSPLSKESIESVVGCLSSTATGKTLTLKATAVASAFETSEGAADGCESSEWLELVGSKPNWTIIAGTYTWNS